MTRGWIFAMLMGCAPTFVPVRIDEPAGAHVTLHGAGATVESTTPVVARLEAGNAWCAGFPIELDLDAAAAARYGHDAAVRIYGRVNVGRLPHFTRELPLIVSPGQEQLRALLRGELERVFVPSCGAASCNACAGEACPHEVVATIELRLKPF
jgi:hypothetical protein